MMNMHDDAIEHARREYPRESCGIVVRGRYYPCRNEAKNPGEQFVMNKNDMMDAMNAGDMEAIIHSHPEAPPTPSAADRAGCEATDLPWGIIGITMDDDGNFGVKEQWITPSGYEAPLIGRQYVWGVFDCLSIVLDYYKREMGIDLGEFERPSEDWHRFENDIYVRNLTEKGFYRLGDGERPAQGDIVLMQIRAKSPNHAAIFLENGILSTEPEHYPAPMSILHHLEGKNSVRDIYGGYWAEKTVSIWRLKDLKPSDYTAS